ncbi:hypothetical protein TWF718_003119 [Orbilia javanica]|uniref:F-box domain-containing protein n=1 Tax=Orbilia javanica TaxID=47235 RepID=A0AAN8MML9_9PEZI
MASLNAVPTEVLIQIFNDEVLDSGDLARCARACSRFRNIIYYSGSCGLEFVFEVDNLNHSAWKFAKQLLLNPQSGQRIRKIRLTWHRRQRRWPETWTEAWYWTEYQLSQIYDICEEWKIRSVYPAIRDGFNSEALLPLLLCFTTNLKSLDLGGVAAALIQNDPYGYRMSDVRKIFDYNRRDEGKWNIQNWYDSGGATFNKRGIAQRDCVLWIYSTMTPDPWLPGFSSLKEFKCGVAELDSYWNISSGRLLTTNLEKITALPRLETLRLLNIRACVGRHAASIGLPEQISTSSLKHVEIIGYLYPKTLMEKIAALTANSLESISYHCRTVPSGGYRFVERSWGSDLEFQNIEDSQAMAKQAIVRVFRKAKMKKLTEDRIEFTEWDTEDDPSSSGYDSSEQLMMSDMDPYLKKKLKNPNWNSEEEMDVDFSARPRKDSIEPRSLEDYIVPPKTRRVKGRKGRSHFVG